MITLDVQSAAASAVVAAAPARVQRFTLDGDDALEIHLAQTCARVLRGIRGLIPAAKLECLLLGGGYGRGEGGVLRGPEGDRPYNNLEFYVAIEGIRPVNEIRYQRGLEVLAATLTQFADVEIEFKITSLAGMRTRPVSMFSYDLLAGHRVLWSRPDAQDLPGCQHHRSAESITEAEATRLLMNRGTGLLLARIELARAPFSPAAADFVRRNTAKAQLACGDALLTSFGRYHWSCRERHHRLEQLAASQPWPWLDSVLRHHRAGVDFKLHPVSGGASRDALAHLHAELTALALQCWLCVESRRLGRAFPSAAAYAADPVDKWAGANPLLNFLRNFRANRFRFRARPRPWRHPRQRIFNALALLLWEPAALTDPVLRARLGMELNLRPSSDGEWLPAYRALWQAVR